MEINQSLNEVMLRLRGSHQFTIETKNKKYKVRRNRFLPEFRVFRLIFPRIIAQPTAKAAQTKFRFRLDGIGIFMLIIFFLALFTPWIPMEEGEELGYHPIVPFLAFAYYIGFLIFEVRTTKKVIHDVLEKEN